MQIVGKGMKPEDKLGVIQALNIAGLISKLTLDDEEFIERVANLCNITGIALCEAYNMSNQAPDVKAATRAQIETLWPFMLQFLSNEYDDTSTRVLPFVNETLQMLKRQAKQGGLGDTDRTLLRSLLEAIVGKMEYDADAEWTASPEDEDDVAFHEMRSALKTHFDAIASIDEALFTGYVHGFIGTTLRNVASGAQPSWMRVELAVQLVYWLGETARGQIQLFQKQADGTTNATPFGEVVACVFESNVASYPHPAVLVPYFECAVRYASFFEVRRDCILPTLACFLDERGLHNSCKPISRRSWYLFARFVKTLKVHLVQYTGDILKGMQDLFVIQPEAVEDDSSMNRQASTFDSQVYLFETAGSLISADGVDPSKQTAFLETALQPILSGIQQHAASPGTVVSDPVASLHLSRLIMAIGAVAKGFPTVDKQQAPTGPWVAGFKQAIEIVLAATEQLKTVAVVRDAARYSFSRFVNCLGVEVLAYLPPFIVSVIGEGEPNEVTDFLAFLSLIVHKFKPSIGDVIDELFLPLASRIFAILEQPTTGTDEAVMQGDVRRGFLSFLVSLFNFELQDVLISQRNQAHANSVFMLIVRHARDCSSVATQKLAFSLLGKMTSAWAGTTQAGTTVLPGFEQFLYTEIIPVCFEVPMKPEFNMADGQTQLAFGELAGALKLAQEKRGAELLQYLRDVYFPSIQCPAEVGQGVLQALEQLDIKRFRTFFRDFVRKSRPSENGASA
ncbi:armadillo-type protein [Thamnocephalis sphaerospora]|uniref:Exportin-T n=1 Tax=Thamnocephalis sphaerospora TaxID=78915 RepID=A0A4P9XH09_9FUNG|nr:armadillo-type protein [Thamnocephalis sphaerospora]|eukprot:RKP04898.1 armadillo-type protein [Thamnocephalis sphaerospora]